MILYSVTVNIDNNVQEEWLQWMRSVHVPEVLATGLFVENRILKLLNEEDNGGSTYSFQYLLKSMDDYNTYQKEHAPALQASHKMRYADRFVAFRTLLEVVE